MHAFTDMTRGSFAPDAAGVAASTPPSTRGSSTASRRRCWAPAIRDAKPKLRKALRATIKAMLASGQNNPLRKLYPVHEGFGRTDALGRIGNTAFGDHLVRG